VTDLYETVAEYVGAHKVLTLATHGPLGLWAAAVFYVNEDYTFYFLSAGDTRHAQNLAQVPRAAGTIQDDDVTWREIQGVQLEGAVQRLTGDNRQHAVDLYRRRFPFLDHAPDAVQTAMQAVEWYRLIPDKLYFIDNRRGFGNRDRIL
jgi:uncharacterized protein YhbP (UPF0306 family)